MRRMLRSGSVNWLALPLAIAAALTLGNSALTYQPGPAPEPRPFVLSAGRQPSGHIPYWIDARFTEAEAAAIRRAFDVWQGAPGSPIAFLYQGRSATVDGVTDDGMATVVRASHALDLYPETVVAVTEWRLEDTSTGPVGWTPFRDTDILVDFSGRTVWSEDGRPGTHDLQSVVTHEVGHLLGLADATEYGQAMYPVSDPGDLSQRVLHAGDVAGLFAAYGYPTGTVAPRPVDGPR